MNLTETCIVISTALGLTLSGCEKKPKTIEVSNGDGGPAPAHAIDPALAKAVKAAAGRKKGAMAQPEQAGGPPPSGVFAPGRADKLMPKGAAPKITLGSQGAEPRVDLSAMQPKPGFAKKASVEFSLQNGRRGLPPLDVLLDLRAQKAAAGSTEKGAAAKAAPVQMVVRIDGAKFNSSMGNVPENVQRALAKLRGSHVDYEIGPNGAGSGLQYTLSKDTPQLDAVILRSLSEGFATLALPYPNKPVGKGGYWMATTREAVAGVDVVAYHLVKVDSVSGNKVSLNIDTKRYAANDQMDTAELPPGLGQVKLTEFQANSSGTLVIVKGTPVPVSGQLQQVLQAGLSASAKPGQKLGLQSSSKFVFTLSAPGGH